MHHRGEEATGLSPVWVRPVRVCVVAPAKPASAFYSLNPLLSATTAPATHSPPLGLSPCLCVPAAAAVVPACFSSLPQQPPRVGLTGTTSSGVAFRLCASPALYCRYLPAARATTRSSLARSLSSPRVCARLCLLRACSALLVLLDGLNHGKQPRSREAMYLSFVQDHYYDLYHILSYRIVSYSIISID